VSIVAWGWCEAGRVGVPYAPGVVLAVSNEGWMAIGAMGTAVVALVVAGVDIVRNWGVRKQSAAAEDRAEQALAESRRVADALERIATPPEPPDVVDLRLERVSRDGLRLRNAGELDASGVYFALVQGSSLQQLPGGLFLEPGASYEVLYAPGLGEPKLGELKVFWSDETGSHGATLPIPP